MSPYERHNLYKPYPKLSPMDIYPKTTVLVFIIICLIAVSLFAWAVGMPGAY